MKINILSKTLIIFFVVIFFIFYKGLNNSNIYVPKVNIIKDVPSFTANIFNSSKKVKSEEIFNDNQFYLVNIWASWCIPCKEEHLFLVDLSKNKNITIIGINYKDKIKNAKNFLSELENPYQMIIEDSNGITSIEWGAYGVPETFLIRNKKIIKKIVGPIDIDSFLEIKEIVQ